MTYMRRARRRRTLKVLSMVAIIGSIVGLDRFHYATGYYVAQRNAEVEAIKHGAGIYDLRRGHGGRFIWWDDIVRMRDEYLKRQFINLHHRPGPDRPAILYFFQSPEPLAKPITGLVTPNVKFCSHD